MIQPNKIETTKENHAEKALTSNNNWACYCSRLLWFPSFGEKATEASQELFPLEAELVKL